MAAILGTIVAVVLIALVIYWPNFFIKDSSKREFVGMLYATPIAIVVIIAAVLLARCKRRRQNSRTNTRPCRPQHLGG